MINAFDTRTRHAASLLVGGLIELIISYVTYDLSILVFPPAGTVDSVHRTRRVDSVDRVDRVDSVDRGTP